MNGRKNALMLASCGLVLAIGINATLELEVFFEFPIPILVGVATLFGMAGSLGAVLAPVVAHRKASDFVIGAAFGLFTLLCAGLAGSAASLLFELETCSNGLGECIYDWVYKPLHWILLFGGFPAIILGVVYTYRVGQEPPLIGQKNELRKASFVAALVVLITPIAAPILFTGEETVMRKMRWVVSDDPAEGQIRLIFVDAPHHFQDLESKELKAWLESRQAPTVNVTFSLTRDFGRIRSSSLDSIDGWSGGLSDTLRGGGVGCGGDLHDCSTPPGQRKRPW